MASGTTNCKLDHQRKPSAKQSQGSKRRRTRPKFHPRPGAGLAAHRRALGERTWKGCRNRRTRARRWANTAGIEPGFPASRRACAFACGCCTNPRRAHWSLSTGGVEKAESPFGRDAPCPASGLPAPPAVVTTSGAQVFADGFVQQPRMTASVRARAALTLAQDDEQAPGPPPRSRLLRHGEAEVCRVDPDTPGPRPKRPWVCELRRASFCHDSSMVGPGALLRQRCRSCGLAT
jgi:hypothetical protein